MENTVIRLRKLIDEQLLSKANYKFCTLNEFNHAFKKLVNKMICLLYTPKQITITL